MENLGFKDETSGSAAALAAANSLQLIAFSIGEQTYGVEITTVREIRAWNGATPLPNTREFVRGVINLRGKVIPITDLRMKFGMDAEDSEDSCIIVVQMRGIQTGIVVDRVSEVVAITEADIEDAPSFGAGIRTEFLLGIGKTGERVKLLLDIDKVLATTELAALEAAQSHDD